MWFVLPLSSSTILCTSWFTERYTTSMHAAEIRCKFTVIDARLVPEVGAQPRQSALSPLSD